MSGLEITYEVKERLVEDPSSYKIYVCPQALPLWIMPDGILFLLRLEFMSKGIDFTLMSSEGGMKESQNCGFKSDVRCHLSQTAQHRSHFFMCMMWRLMLRERF